MNGHICFSVRENCENLLDSYGELCVRCNACGRFDQTTKHQCQLDVLKRHQAENANFNDWIEGAEELQRNNQTRNAEWYAAKIKEVEGLMESEGE